jgi:hypothetical protein
MLASVAMVFIILTLVVFYHYNYKRRYGLWKENYNDEYDLSLVWKIKYLTFGLLSNPEIVNIPPDSTFISTFRGVKMFDIYDDHGRHIKHYYNPQLIILKEGIDIFSSINYHCLLRYHEESKVEANSYIEIEKKDININPIYDICPKEYYDENYYQKESKKFMKKIIKEMDEDGYSLESIKISGLRRSFPSDMLLNEITVDLEEDKKVVVMVTNKLKIFSLDEHQIEFDSLEKKFIWNPSGTDNFSFLILDEGEDVEITVREYLYCDPSNLLPITVLVFC